MVFQIKYITRTKTMQWIINSAGIKRKADH